MIYVKGSDMTSEYFWPPEPYVAAETFEANAKVGRREWYWI